METLASESFFDTLLESGLVSSEELQQARARAGADPEAAIRWLVSEGRLTPWQAKQLAAGHTDLVIDKYLLLEKLGEGGMGTVFKVLERGIERVVALKLLSADVIARNPQAVERFRREVLASASLNHPNIVAAHSADQVGDKHFLIMEYVEGRPLRDWIRRYRPLPKDWACEVVRQTCFGLTHAHERGLVHRDIKPSNLLVIADDFSQRPMVKILDFGLVRLVGETWAERNLTAADQVLGTPDYIAPEQAYDPRAADIRSDIFSLGCTLFQMLTGQVPFHGKTPVEKLMARAGRNAPRVRTLAPDVSVELDDIVAKMLAHDPSKRYQTPNEVAGALGPFAYKRPLSGLASQRGGTGNQPAPSTQVAGKPAAKPVAPAVAPAVGKAAPAPRSEPAEARPAPQSLTVGKTAPPTIPASTRARPAAASQEMDPPSDDSASDARTRPRKSSVLRMCFKLLLVVIVIGGAFAAGVIFSGWK